MSDPAPIIDYHGTEVTEGIVYKSAGVYVYLDVGADFARLTPDQADELATRLKESAAEARKIQRKE